MPPTPGVVVRRATDMQPRLRRYTRDGSGNSKSRMVAGESVAAAAKEAAKILDTVVQPNSLQQQQQQQQPMKTPTSATTTTNMKDLCNDMKQRADRYTKHAQRSKGLGFGDRVQAIGRVVPAVGPLPGPRSPTMPRMQRERRGPTAASTSSSGSTRRKVASVGEPARQGLSNSRRRRKRETAVVPSHLEPVAARSTIGASSWRLVSDSGSSSSNPNRRHTADCGSGSEYKRGATAGSKITNVSTTIAVASATSRSRRKTAIVAADTAPATVHHLTIAAEGEDTSGRPLVKVEGDEGMLASTAGGLDTTATTISTTSTIATTTATTASSSSSSSTIANSDALATPTTAVAVPEQTSMSVPLPMPRPRVRVSGAPPVRKTTTLSDTTAAAAAATTTTATTTTEIAISSSSSSFSSSSVANESKKGSRLTRTGLDPSRVERLRKTLVADRTLTRWGGSKVGSVTDTTSLGGGGLSMQRRKPSYDPAEARKYMRYKKQRDRQFKEAQQNKMDSWDRLRRANLQRLEDARNRTLRASVARQKRREQTDRLIKEHAESPPSGATPVGAMAAARGYTSSEIQLQHQLHQQLEYSVPPPSIDYGAADVLLQVADGDDIRSGHDGVVDDVSHLAGTLAARIERLEGSIPADILTELQTRASNALAPLLRVSPGTQQAEMESSLLFGNGKAAASIIDDDVMPGIDNIDKLVAKDERTSVAAATAAAANSTPAPASAPTAATDADAAMTAVDLPNSAVDGDPAIAIDDAVAATAEPLLGGSFEADQADQNVSLSLSELEASATATIPSSAPMFSNPKPAPTLEERLRLARRVPPPSRPAATVPCGGGSSSSNSSFSHSIATVAAMHRDDGASIFKLHIQRHGADIARPSPATAAPVTPQSASASLLDVSSASSVLSNNSLGSPVALDRPSIASQHAAMGEVLQLKTQQQQQLVNNFNNNNNTHSTEIETTTEQDQHDPTLFAIPSSPPPARTQSASPAVMVAGPVSGPSMAAAAAASVPATPWRPPPPLPREAYVCDGNRMRLSPGALEAKLRAEMDLLQAVETSLLQITSVQSGHDIVLAQQETVALAQAMRAREAAAAAREAATASQLEIQAQKLAAASEAAAPQTKPVPMATPMSGAVTTAHTANNTTATAVSTSVAYSEDFESGSIAEDSQSSSVVVEEDLSSVSTAASPQMHRHRGLTASATPVDTGDELPSDLEASFGPPETPGLSPGVASVTDPASSSGATPEAVHKARALVATNRGARVLAAQESKARARRQQMEELLSKQRQLARWSREIEAENREVERMAKAALEAHRRGYRSPAGRVPPTRSSTKFSHSDGGVGVATDSIGGSGDGSSIDESIDVASYSREQDVNVSTDIVQEEVPSDGGDGGHLGDALDIADLSSVSTEETGSLALSGKGTSIREELSASVASAPARSYSDTFEPETGSMVVGDENLSKSSGALGAGVGAYYSDTFEPTSATTAETGATDDLLGQIANLQASLDSKLRKAEELKVERHRRTRRTLTERRNELEALVAAADNELAREAAQGQITTGTSLAIATRQRVRRPREDGRASSPPLPLADSSSRRSDLVASAHGDRSEDDVPTEIFSEEEEVLTDSALSAHTAFTDEPIDEEKMEGGAEPAAVTQVPKQVIYGDLAATAAAAAAADSSPVKSPARKESSLVPEATVPVQISPSTTTPSTLPSSSLRASPKSPHSFVDEKADVVSAETLVSTPAPAVPSAVVTGDTSASFAADTDVNVALLSSPLAETAAAVVHAFEAAGGSARVMLPMSWIKHEPALVAPNASASTRAHIHAVFDFVNQTLAELLPKEPPAAARHIPAWAPPDRRAYRGARRAPERPLLQLVMERIEGVSAMQDRPDRIVFDELLRSQIRDEEVDWVNYDVEEVELKLHIADMLFDDLLADGATWLASLDGQ